MFTPGQLRKLVISCLLFVSGATGLVYELVWSKHLGNVLGNSGQAHAVVLATFMGGLALGAYVFGRHADRVKSPLFMYGALELGIGLYALIFTPILGALGAAYLSIATAVPESVRIFPKLFLASLSLLPPTMLMGGTLPSLARHFTTHMGGMQRELARLYAVNSLGASVGVFLAGVKLVPAMGLEASSRLAAVFNIALAIGAMLLARKHQAPEESTLEATAEPELVYPAAAVRAALVGTALSGFTAMLYEVTWIRLLAIVLGASTYAFTLILTAFILGIGLGSFWLTTRTRRGDALALFGRLQVFLVIAVCGALPFYVRLPHYFMVAYHGLNRTLETWPWYQLITFSFCCAVLLVPTFFMGASFPSAARAATAKVAELGRQLGGVYLWNTVGTISGSLLGGLVLLPWLGMEGNFAVGLVCNILAAGLALWFAPTRARRPIRALWPVAASMVCAVVYLASSAGWSSFVADALSHRESSKPFPSFQAFVAATKKDVEIRFHRDDIFATVLVGEIPKENQRYMRINGKVDASNGIDAQTQVLAGHLGVLLHEREVKKVLLIGAGAAITAGSILTHPIEKMDLVEISPAVIEAARFFGPDNRHALDDPRLRVTIDDAKTFLALTKEKYDLIVSVPSNPWVTGVSGLFSQDFFRVAKEHLGDDGVIVQWIHTYASSEELVTLVMRTLRDTFPHGTTWAGPLDLVMVASLKPLHIELDRLAARMERPNVKDDLTKNDIPDLVTLLAKQMHSDEAQAELAGKGTINTDDLNVLEFVSPIAYYMAKDYVRVKDERRGPDGGARLLLKRYLAEHPLSVLEAKRIHINLVKNHREEDPLVRSIAERWRALAPEDPEAALALGKAALAQSDLITAREALAPLVSTAEPSAEVAAAFGGLVARELLWRRSVFGPPPEADRAFSVVKSAHARAGSHRGLARALKELCAVHPDPACERAVSSSKSGQTSLNH